MVRRGVAVWTWLVVSAAMVAACGEQEASVLDRAFEREIQSAQVRFDVTLTEGRQRAPLVRLALRGPFRRNGEAKLASFDWRLRMNGHHGDRFAARVISTGENVFVRYAGETYEVGERAVRMLNREAARQQSGGGQVEDLDDVRRLGVDLREWFPASDTERDASLAGEDTTHVSGRLDVSTALRDLARLLRHPAFARRPELSALPRLTNRDIEAIDRTISDPRFDVHVGERDGKFRRIAGRLRFRIPQEQRDGAAFGQLAVSLQFVDVDQPVSINAPKGGRPIEELLRKLDGAEGSMS